MQANSWYLVASLLLLGGWDGTAATTIASAYGTQLMFSDWSSPETFLAKSSEGTDRLVRRVCRVSEQHPRWTKSRTVDLIFHPAVNEVWLGETAPQYLVFKQKI